MATEPVTVTGRGRASRAAPGRYREVPPDPPRAATGSCPKHSPSQQAGLGLTAHVGTGVSGQSMRHRGHRPYPNPGGTSPFSEGLLGSPHTAPRNPVPIHTAFQFAWECGETHTSLLSEVQDRGNPSQKQRALARRLRTRSWSDLGVAGGWWGRGGQGSGGAQRPCGLTILHGDLSCATRSHGQRAALG